jgi:EAL domain-containing protein (putative c-di-GMP-specific phosphodiesterase class I)
MCEDLGMNVLLEGVETMAQLSLARECGVGFVQGYLLSRPVVAVPGRHLPVPDPALPDPGAPSVEH